jgi:hypothetical protein
MTISLNNGGSFVSALLGTLFLAGLPILSHAADCAEIKEKYWSCVRSSMTNEPCTENISIPPECLRSGTETIQNYESSPDSTSHFFGSEKKSTPVATPTRESVPKKSVKIINIKPAKGKIYFETEDDVNQYTTKIRNDLLNGIKEGKRVRLTFD